VGLPGRLQCIDLIREYCPRAEKRRGEIQEQVDAAIAYREGGQRYEFSRHSLSFIYSPSFWSEGFLSAGFGRGTLIGGTILD
jgi:hypothetical protein